MNSSANILAVDDTPDVLTLLARILTKEGHNVRTAESGELALACIASLMPDLVLLDVRLKGLCGLDVCRQLKEREETRHIPIILISAFADVNEWVDGLRLGASDYITKPFQPEELRSRVRTHLALRHATASFEKQAAVLRQTNDQLQVEIQERHHIENELRRSLDAAERTRLAMLSIIEDHQQAAEALRQSEEKFRELFEASCDGIMILEPPNWSFSAVNAAAYAMFRANDIADLLLREPSELSPSTQPDGRSSVLAAKDKIEEALRDGNATFEWTHKRLDGDEFIATVRLARMDRAGRLRLQATVRDISEQKRLETELGHSRKLEAVGSLAAGIAHEINTPSQYVGDGLQFLRDAFDGYRRLLSQYRLAESAESGLRANGESFQCKIREIEREIDLVYLEENVPSALERCIDGVSRIATIVRAMKEFAHPDQREMVAADLNHALQNTLTITRNEYKYIAEVEMKLGELPPVFCHLGDLNQVFLNLIVNAAQAIGGIAKCGEAKGIIRIVTMRDGDWVQIDVADTGPGIPEPIRGRIFEPFFTTKEVGKGSGQGLAIAHSIVVVRHRGTLTFRTEVGVGTTFSVRLPVNGQDIESVRSVRRPTDWVIAS